MTGELVAAERLSPPPYVLVEESIAKASRVRQQHPHGDPVLLIHEFRLPMLVHILQDANGLELRTKIFDLIGVIETQFALFDQLHDSDTSDQFRARCYPEDGVKGHGGLAVGTFPATGVLEKSLSIFVDHDQDTSRDLVGVCGDVVDCFANFRGSRWLQC